MVISRLDSEERTGDGRTDGRPKFPKRSGGVGNDAHCSRQAGRLWVVAMWERDKRALAALSLSLSLSPQCHLFHLGWLAVRPSVSLCPSANPEELLLNAHKERNVFVRF